VEQPKSKDPQRELEIALSELEERVDRLRALYEQYFMGYEKIEPSVQRKDVDRRFTALRKQQIRNTASRFRFNVITQKFNTYAMYWTRVCRQIEEGTFKRHIAKANRRFGGPTTTTTKQREPESSIDVDLTDFDDDLDAVLAEANAAAEAYGRGSQDTVPPGTPSIPTPNPVTVLTPNTAFAAAEAQRSARHVALPPGARQPLLIRRTPAQATPPASEPRPAPPPPAALAHAVVNAGAKPAPTSVGRIATPGAAAPPASPPKQAPPSMNRVPSAATASPHRSPAAGAPPPQQQAGSVNRVPAAVPASANRVPVAAPAPAPKAPAASSAPSPNVGNRPPPPQAPASPLRIPTSPAPYRPVARPPGSANRIPVTRTPGTPIVPVGRPPSTGKIPSSEGSEPTPPSRRPPPPLPSQSTKKTER
jgi:hypothetical protein